MGSVDEKRMLNIFCHCHCPYKCSKSTPACFSVAEIEKEDSGGTESSDSQQADFIGESGRTTAMQDCSQAGL